MTDHLAVDPAALDRLGESLGGDLSFLSELVETYLEDSTGLVAAMDAALEAGDAERLCRTAHSLKSSSATIGALRLSALSRELELSARSGQLTGAAERISLITAEFEAVRRGLASFPGVSSEAQAGEP